MTQPLRSRIASAALALGLLLTSLYRPANAESDPEWDAALANAEYGGIYDEPVRLTDGRFEGEPFVSGGESRPTVRLVKDLTARGDLDGDGKEDAAVLLVESSGGSGSFVYLAALSLAGTEAKNLATTLIGDRAQVRELAFAGGALTLDLVVAGEDDAAASPATKVRKTFRLSGDKLAESAAEELGNLSLADLENTAWALHTMVVGDTETAPEGSITTSFAKGRITGNAGCNRYFGSVEDEERGAFFVIEMGATRMACPQQTVMDQEQAFLERLGQTVRFGYRFGNLVLSGPGGALIFTPHKP